MRDLIHVTDLVVSVGLVLFLCGCWSSHEIESVHEIKPIHITIDVNVKVDKALDDYFGELDEKEKQLSDRKLQKDGVEK